MATILTPNLFVGKESKGFRIRMSVEAHTSLKEASQATGRSMGEIMEYLVREYLMRVGDDEDEKG